MNIRLTFAKDKKDKRTPPKLDQQTGSAVTKMQKLYEKYALDNRQKNQAADFERLRSIDGTFLAINNLLTLPILASEWAIEADEEFDPTGEQAELVRNSFELPPERGGMSTPFHLVLAEMLRALSEGYRYFEKVYTLNADGKIVYRKIAGYDACTITIRTDDKGGFDGADQRINPGEEPVHIPVEKSFLFTNSKERNWLKGESLFTAAAYHCEEKHKLYYFGRLQAQSGSVPPRVAVAAERATSEQMSDVAERLSDTVEMNSAVVMPFGYQMVDSKSNQRMDIMPLIDHHNREMTRSVLAQAIMLGDNSGGSWALSKDQTGLLNLVLEGIMKNVEYHINAYLIPDLTELNFAKPSYPRFKFAKLADSTVGMLSDAFTQILSQRPEALSDELVQAIVERMALQMGIDLGEIEKAQAEAKLEQKSRSEESSRFLSSSAEPTWRRELNDAEKNVNLSALDKKMDTLEDTLDAETESIFEAVKDEATTALKALEKQGKELSYKVSQKLRQRYFKTLQTAMTDGFNYGKTAAANELGKLAPATDKTDKQRIANRAQEFVDLQFGDVEAEIAALVGGQDSSEMARRHFSEGAIDDVLDDLAIALLAYLAAHTKPGNTVAVAESINTGRTKTFKKYDEDIDRYVYSAILDKKTCQTCRELDEKVATPEEYATTPWQTPIHFRCRCIWIAVLAEEEEKPEITGMPTIAGGLAGSQLLQPST